MKKNQFNIGYMKDPSMKDHIPHREQVIKNLYQNVSKHKKLYQNLVNEKMSQFLY